MKDKKEFIGEINTMIDDGEYLKIVPSVEGYVEQINKRVHMAVGEIDDIHGVWDLPNVASTKYALDVLISRIE